MNSKPKLIVIDDEADIAEFVRALAESVGFDARAASDPDTFHRLYEDGADVVALDLFMPTLDGVEIIRFLSESGDDPALILMSGFDARVLDSTKGLAEAHGLFVAGANRFGQHAGELRRMLIGIVPRVREIAPDSNIPISFADLACAVARGEIVTYFQPKVTIDDRRLVGVEALVRWRHPDLGLVPPDAFIPLAESSGLIDDITVTVIDHALAACQSNRIEGTVSVNMSVQSLASLDLPERVLRMLAERGQNPERLTIEITESGLMRELTKTLDVLTRLRLKGVGLSIDDFGTGYSSLQQLRRVPFSELKVDRGFVDGIESDTGNQAIVQSIVDLGHKFGMMVVAEGIETESQYEILGGMGCDVAQGYLIGRPQPFDAVIGSAAAA